MKKLKWHVANEEQHDDKVATRLRRLLLKVYKYAAKHGLWEVSMYITNYASGTVDCYAEVSAWCHGANVVHDDTSLPIIEE